MLPPFLLLRVAGADGWNDVGMKFFRRRWREDSGDAYASWGPSWWYFATDDKGLVQQQAETTRSPQRPTRR
jgi:nuclear transport factor 2 (NTF2) superfamily protein